MAPHLGAPRRFWEYLSVGGSGQPAQRRAPDGPPIRPEQGAMRTVDQMAERDWFLRLAAVSAIGAVLATGCDSVSQASDEIEAAEPATEPAEVMQDHLHEYSPEGLLLRPEGWESWVLAGTSIGLTYNERAPTPAGEAPGFFLNVYIQPWAYEQFMETAAFPEGSMFVPAGSQPQDRADPALGGFYQGELALLEVHVKNQNAHDSGWGFYDFVGDEDTGEIHPADADCYSCHRDEAGYDNVFVQFYPTMCEKLLSEGLLSP